MGNEQTTNENYKYLNHQELVVHGYTRINSILQIPKDIQNLFLKFYFYHFYLDLKYLHSFYEIGTDLNVGNNPTTTYKQIKCKRKSDSNPFAIKIINFKRRHKIKKYFVNNHLHIMSKLNHPNVIKMHQIFVNDKQIYLILESMKIDLCDIIIESDKINEKNAVLLFKQLLSALSYIHNLGIIHRNINVESLRLTSININKYTCLKLADFDMATFINTKYKHRNVSDSQLVGLPNYIAPEVLKGEEYGTKSDLWSSGVVLYTMLVGFPPFHLHHDHYDKLFQRIKNGKYKMRSRDWKSVSNDAKDLVKRLLQIDPNKRLSADKALRHEWFDKNSTLKSQFYQMEIANFEYFKY